MLPTRRRAIERRLGTILRPGSFAIAALCVAIASCASLKPAPSALEAGARAPNPEEIAQLRSLLGALAARDRELVSVQSPVVMEYTAGGKTIKAREQLVARRPASLRIDAMSPLGVALIVAAQDTDLQIFEPSQNKLIHAPATADALNRYVRIPMAPRDAVGLLMGLAPQNFALDSAPPTIVVEDGGLVASWSDADSGSHELGFAADQLATVRETASGGAIRYEVRYSNYQDIGGVMFPYLVEADFPAAQSHLTLRYQRPIINGDVPDSTFVLAPAAPTASGERPGLVNDNRAYAAMPPTLD